MNNWKVTSAKSIELLFLIMLIAGLSTQTPVLNEFGHVNNGPNITSHQANSNTALSTQKYILQLLYS